MFGRQILMASSLTTDSPRFIVRFVALILAIAALASGCAVAPESAQLTLNATAVDDAAARAAADAASPTPTQPIAIETNDEGEQLLQRFLIGSFESSDCDFVDMSALPVQPDCGWLTRPLHGAIDIENIELPVTIFAATGDTPAAEPLIYLHGGPSDGILQFFEFEQVYDLIIEPFIETRTVIVFDQRGTGLAEPDLRCDSAYSWFNAKDEDPTTFVSRTARNCAFDLKQDGIRLDQFSRQSSADDVMVLARELGYDQFDLHGSSWGGILGYTVMQAHPEWVRSALLDSPLSITTDLTGSMPRSFQEAMQAVQANCELSPSCATEHGDIVERYLRVFDALEDDPLELLIAGFFPVDLTADELSYMLFGLLYDPDAIAKIPDLLRQIENRNPDLAQELVNIYGLGWGIDFTFLTYMCMDIVPASSPEQVEAQQIGIEAFDRVDDAPDGRGHTAQAICERMQARPPGRPTLREVTPTTPTMVFSGSMDPITPLSSGRQIAESIPNGYFVGFRDLSHGVTQSPCGSEIALAFLADPSVEPDLSCSLPENRPPFEFGTG